MNMIPSAQLVLNPSDRRQAVVDVLRSATRNLVLSIFRCDDFGIIGEITDAVNRNVGVKVLISRRAKGWEQRLSRLAELLASAGAEVCRYNRPTVKYHAKYIVADDTTALVSSSNFTHKCFKTTCDFLLVGHDPQVINGLKNLFEHDCHTPDTAAPQVSERLIVGPENTRERFTRLLESAKTNISIMDHRVTDPRMIELIEAKRRGGVNVRILGRGNSAGLLSHGKMIVVDDQQAVIGSVALSQVSLDTRREVAITIEEPELVLELSRFFEYCSSRHVEHVPTDNIDEDDEDREDDAEHKG
jgi:cardiolipin synthase